MQTWNLLSCECTLARYIKVSNRMYDIYIHLCQCQLCRLIPSFLPSLLLREFAIPSKHLEQLFARVSYFIPSTKNFRTSIPPTADRELIISFQISQKFLSQISILLVSFPSYWNSCDVLMDWIFIKRSIVVKIKYWIKDFLCALPSCHSYFLLAFVSRLAHRYRVI